MARMIAKYPLTKSAQVQNIDMPRRARLLCIAMDTKGPAIFAEVLVDADTKAFDVPHTRRFAVVSAGGVAPEGSGHIGSCTRMAGKVLEDFHVYEVRTPTPRGF